MTAGEFEQKVWDVDGIRIVIRAPWGTEVDAYDWVNAANAGWRVNHYCAQRIATRLRGLEYQVLDGYGQAPHGNTQLSGIRAGYTR